MKMPKSNAEVRTPNPKNPPSFLTDDDLYLFNEGSHFRLYEKLGAHPTTVDGVNGVHFAVWAPDAERVCVVGDFNEWKKDDIDLHPVRQSGIWEGFVAGANVSQCYKFHIASRYHGYKVEKTDPYAMYYEVPPRTASVVWNLDYSWNDAEWMKNRSARNAQTSPISIYELHLASWMRIPEDNNRYLTYREIAPKLAEYVKNMGFTHIELMPVMEHPFSGSWGYQITGYFAPTSRFGTSQDFMYLIDVLHQNGIGVILDWAPSHFPTDEHGLGYFDGTHLYEHFYQERGYHPDWKTYIFNYGRHEIRSFLISSALFWFEKYHIEGLRVDAVASMLYNDYSRKEGEWMPNSFGGRENLEAVAFLRRLNEEVYKHFPDVQMYAEESTAWPAVSRPTYAGGLGFGFKWDMGWMHDTLVYITRDPAYRRYHHSELTFRMLYASTENFVLPLSHDEVVHGKASLLSKMPGDDWQKFANLRLLFGYMYGQPGKKLLFMGGEFGQWREWQHDESLDWHLLQYERHSGLQRWTKDLNHAYQREPALHELDMNPEGFEWIDCNDTEGSILSFLRKSKNDLEVILAVFNFTPVPRFRYRLGIPREGFWKELLNSDAVEYWGSGQGNLGGVYTSSTPCHGRLFSIELNIPPLSAIFLKSVG